MDPDQGQQQPTDDGGAPSAPAASTGAPAAADAPISTPAAEPAREQQPDAPVQGSGAGPEHGEQGVALGAGPSTSEALSSHTEQASDVAASESFDMLPVAGGVAALVVLAGIALLATRKRSAVALPLDTKTARPASSDTKAPPKGLARFREALTRTREALGGGLGRLFGDSFDESALEELEMLLLSSDVGMPTTQRLLEKVRVDVRSGESDPTTLRATLLAEMTAILDGVAGPVASIPEEGPLVILVVGVNGSGKTTTIGKLAHRYQQAGKRVLLAAGDTYRAAAAEQLTVWAERTGADIVSHQAGADPGAVVYDALSAAKARGHDVVIVDTAGRLQTRKPLMDQLSKVRRVIQKIVPAGPHETLLVVDGTMGQNALSQARLFDEATPLTGVVVTKLDGTAKGGMVLTIAAELGLAVKLVGIGEQAADLRDFHAGVFVEALS